MPALSKAKREDAMDFRDKTRGIFFKNVLYLD